MELLGAHVWVHLANLVPCKSSIWRYQPISPPPPAQETCNSHKGRMGGLLLFSCCRLRAVFSIKSWDWFDEKGSIPIHACMCRRYNTVPGYYTRYMWYIGSTLVRIQSFLNHLVSCLFSRETCNLLKIESTWDSDVHPPRSCKACRTRRAHRNRAWHHCCGEKS